MANNYREGIRSTASFNGHPIHPILIAFPVAFLNGALVTDLAYWWTAQTFWAQASYWLLIAGLVTGLVAALAGLIDFVTIKRTREHRAGWLHLVINAAALSLALLNLLFRFQDATGAIVPLGLLLSLFTAGLLGAGGWFGGELIYRLKIGVFGDQREPGAEPVRQPTQAGD